jgi:hypothetical protein
MTKPMNIGLYKREAIQTKGTNKLVNIITAENFLNLEKERVIQVQEAYKNTKLSGPKKKHPQKYHN